MTNHFSVSHSGKTRFGPKMVGGPYAYTSGRSSDGGSSDVSSGGGSSDRSSGGGSSDMSSYICWIKWREFRWCWIKWQELREIMWQELRCRIKW